MRQAKSWRGILEKPEFIGQQGQSFHFTSTVPGWTCEVAEQWSTQAAYKLPRTGTHPRPGCLHCKGSSDSSQVRILTPCPFYQGAWASIFFWHPHGVLEVTPLQIWWAHYNNKTVYHLILIFFLPNSIGLADSFFKKLNQNISDYS